MTMKMTPASQAMGQTTNNTMFFPTVETAEAWLDRPAEP
jgi:hypothetical protein